jgi:hypothetical protein
VPEYLKFRCCLCPDINTTQLVTCPPNPPRRPAPTPCRFVKKYIDSRGWKYRVKAGLGGDTFSCFYQKPEKSGELGWKSMKSMPWRDCFSTAQSDLNALAKKKGWSEWDGPETS